MTMSAPSAIVRMRLITVEIMKTTLYVSTNKRADSLSTERKFTKKTKSASKKSKKQSGEKSKQKKMQIEIKSATGENAAKQSTRAFFRKKIREEQTAIKISTSI